jgi:hypothetical protein
MTATMGRPPASCMMLSSIRDFRREAKGPTIRPETFAISLHSNTIGEAMSTICLEPRH